MTEHRSEDLPERMRQALDAAARAAVGDQRPVPAFRPDELATVRVDPVRRRRGWLAPALAAAAVIAVAVLSLAAVRVAGGGHANVAAPPASASPRPSGPNSGGPAPVVVPPPVSSAPTATAQTRLVHIRSLESDGSTWGIGMPIILYFDIAPTDPAGFLDSTKVTVNGQPAAGSWFWEKSGTPGAAVEAHYRLSSFWPGHAKIQVSLPPAGTSAGAGLVYDGALSSISMATGAATVGTVNGATSKLTVTSDGKQFGVFPVALGAPNTPTMDGTKVIMYKGRNERMIGSGYDEVVPYAMRLTNSGEYLHAASWNVSNIMSGTPSSNGCSNLLPADAAKLFNFMQLGDPIVYSNVPGNGVKVMPSWDGYGDWNLSWTTWKAGGLLR